jgi:hypothetical protein
MRRRAQPRRVPPGHRLYFQAGGMTWRQPRPSVCGQLAAMQQAVMLPIMARRLAERGIDLHDAEAVKAAVLAEATDTTDGFLAVASSEEAIGALVGVFWANESYDLDAIYPRPASVDALLRYGAAVLDEIHEEGLDLDTGAVASALMERLHALSMPDQTEVEGMVGNGLQAGAPPTS